MAATVGKIWVVDVGCAQALEFCFCLNGKHVKNDGDQLLVQVVEGSAGRAQPVLEGGDVAHGVEAVQVVH